MMETTDAGDHPLVERLDEVRGARLISQEQAGERLMRSPKTLENWRFRGKGPKFVVDEGGRFIGYRESAIDDYLTANEVQSTAEAQALARSREHPGRKPRL